jgi:hypothetical protein
MGLTTETKSVWLVPLLISLICVAGCNSQAIPIHGQVVFKDGSNLPTSGQVIFESVNLDPPVEAKGFFDKDGNFELTKFKGGHGVTAGEYKVAVICNVPDDRGQMSPQEFKKASNPIDPRFRSASSSPIKIAVSAKTASQNLRIEVLPPRQR